MRARPPEPEPGAGAAGDTVADNDSVVVVGTGDDRRPAPDCGLDDARDKRFGIPTTYAGTQFRSRLESRWACFFDLVKWPWEYEPIELDGYIPDFVLPFEAGPLLVEVKPAFAPSLKLLV